MSNRNFNPYVCDNITQHGSNKTEINSVLLNRFKICSDQNKAFITNGPTLKKLKEAVTNKIIDFNMLRYYNCKFFRNVTKTNNSLFRLVCYLNNVTARYFDPEAFLKFIKDFDLRIHMDDFIYSSTMNNSVKLDFMQMFLMNSQQHKYITLIEYFPSYNSYDSLPFSLAPKYYDNFLLKNKNYCKIKSDFINYKNYYRTEQYQEFGKYNRYHQYILKYVYNLIHKNQYEIINRISKIKHNILFTKSNLSELLVEYFDTFKHLQDRNDRFLTSMDQLRRSKFSYEHSLAVLDDESIKTKLNDYYYNYTFYNIEFSKIINNSLLTLESILKLHNSLNLNMITTSIHYYFKLPVILHSIYNTEYRTICKIFKIVLICLIIKKYKNTNKLDLFNSTISNENISNELSALLNPEQKDFVLVGEVVLNMMYVRFKEIFARNSTDLIYFDALNNDYKNLIIETFKYLIDELEEYYITPGYYNDKINLVFINNKVDVYFYENTFSEILNKN